MLSHKFSIQGSKSLRGSKFLRGSNVFEGLQVFNVLEQSADFSTNFVLIWACVIPHADQPIWAIIIDRSDIEISVICRSDNQPIPINRPINWHDR